MTKEPESPLPWHVGADGVTVWSEGGIEKIFEVPCRYRDATYIVGAVNNHARLLAALADLVLWKSASDAHCLAFGGDPPPDLLRWRDAAWSTARLIVQEV